MTLLDWHFKSGDNLHGMFDFNPTYERLWEPFEISPGVFLQPGEYRFTRFRSNLLSTATKRRLSAASTSSTAATGRARPSRSSRA